MSTLTNDGSSFESGPAAVAGPHSRTDREALVRAGFDVRAGIFIGWQPVGDRKLPVPPGAQADEQHHKPLHEITTAQVGIIVQKSGLTILDVDSKDPLYKPLFEACSYVEESYRGRGHHLVFSKSWDFPATNYYKNSRKLEVYSAHSVNRFVAMTGRPLPGKDDLPENWEETDVPALLEREGWTTSASGNATGRRLDLATVPACAWQDQELERAAANLNALAKGEAAEGYPSRSEARQALLTKAAGRAPCQEQLLAWALAQLPLHYAERSNGPRDADTETAKAWAWTHPELPPVAGMAPPIPPEWQADDPGEGSSRSEDAADESGAATTAASLRADDFSDIHLAEAFLAQRSRAGGLSYVSLLGRWYHRDPRTGLWHEDRTMKVQNHAAGFLNKRYETLRTKTDDSKFLKAARSSLLSWRKLQALLDVARCAASVATSPDQWNANGMLLGARTGVIDLTNGKTQPALARDYVAISTALAPGGGAPRWEAFLKRIFRHDPELIAFMQRWCGYCLTGMTSEQKILFCFGTGANGKSTFLETILGVMGDYGLTVASDVFMQRHHEPHATELAQLAGKRLVVASEIRSNAAWDEVRLKQLSGGDTLNANFMRQDKFTFRPVCKLMLFGNRKPGLRHVDDAMRRRILMVPFAQSIPPDERDPQLLTALRAEWPGILAWMIEGCLMWQREGLNPPASILSETNAYFEGEDLIEQWIGEECTRGSHLRTLRADAYRRFAAWLLANRLPTWRKTEFFDEIKRRGFAIAEAGKNRDMCICGLQIRSEMIGPAPLENALADL